MLPLSSSTCPTYDSQLELLFDFNPESTEKWLYPNFNVNWPAVSEIIAKQCNQHHPRNWDDKLKTALINLLMCLFNVRRMLTPDANAREEYQHSIAIAQRLKIGNNEGRWNELLIASYIEFLKADKAKDPACGLIIKRLWFVFNYSGSELHLITEQTVLNFCNEHFNDVIEILEKTHALEPEIYSKFITFWQDCLSLPSPAENNNYTINEIITMARGEAEVMNALKFIGSVYLTEYFIPSKDISPVVNGFDWESYCKEYVGLREALAKKNLIQSQICGLETCLKTIGSSESRNADQIAITIHELRKKLIPHLICEKLSIEFLMYQLQIIKYEIDVTNKDTLIATANRILQLYRDLESISIRIEKKIRPMESIRLIPLKNLLDLFYHYFPEYFSLIRELLQRNFLEKETKAFANQILSSVLTKILKTLHEMKQPDLQPVASSSNASREEGLERATIITVHFEWMEQVLRLLPQWVYKSFIGADV